MEVKNNRTLNLVFMMMIISFSVILSGCLDKEIKDEELPQDKEFIFEAPAHYGNAACLIKLDSSGKILSGHDYSSTPFFECNDLIQTSDGGYMLAGKGQEDVIIDEGNLEVGSIVSPFACSLKVNGDGYTEKVEITMDEVDKTRSFIEAIKGNIGNCKETEATWENQDQAISWLHENVGKATD